MADARGAAFQDQMRDNGCFGCGPNNPKGLRIKSRWSDDGDRAECVFSPEPHMSAGPPQYLNGGIIATVIDCHCICTAVADAYRREGRAIGEGELIWYATGKLDITYQRPVPIDAPVTLLAMVAVVQGRTKSILECELFSGDSVRASAELVAVRVAPAWLSSSAH